MHLSTFLPIPAFITKGECPRFSLALVPAICAIVLGASVVVAPAKADEAAAMQAFLESGSMAFLSDPVLVSAVTAQNATNAGLAQSDIDALDQAWRAEVGQAATPTIDAVLGSTASDFLRAQLDAAPGTFTEIFVMDAMGLNVATATVTSDYWQGDEEKFTETYPKGPGAAHFGGIELDVSTGTYQAQISQTLVDPTTGEAIGAVTVGVNAEALF